MNIQNGTRGRATAKNSWPVWLGASSVEQPTSQVVRAAFAARVSTDDQQDPTLSLPRQLATCQKALPQDMVVTLHFYDVESGRTDLDRRGHGERHTKFEVPIPRDGGIDDLLAEAKRPDRRFDVVICESVDRIARITYYGTKIEYELGQAGVLLLAADEGISMDPRGATSILTRRMKQCIAEWYVLDMLEKSWGGLEEHTKQGWNIGQAPYGYAAERVPHPVPARRADGQHKTRLVLHSDRAATVRTIFELRITERLGYRMIAERLNADPARYPTPVPPDPARAVGRWTLGSVREILHNPKYTGHMVWNRRSTKTGGGRNPVSEWVLSPEPTHPAIVTPDEYATAQAVGRDRERSRSGHQPNTHPKTKHTYALRSYIVCALCDRRMSGKQVNGKDYYSCQATGCSRLPGHPASIVVAEAVLMSALGDFINTHLLGADRGALLTVALVDAERVTMWERAGLLATAEREIAAISVRQDRIVQQVEGDDAFSVRLRHDYNDLDIQRRAHENTRIRLTATPAHSAADATAPLLELLPIASVNLTDIPFELLRELCEAFRIKITYDRELGSAHFSADVSATLIGHLRKMVTQAAATCSATTSSAAGTTISAGALVVTATIAIHSPRPR